MGAQGLALESLPTMRVYAICRATGNACISNAPWETEKRISKTPHLAEGTSMIHDTAASHGPCSVLGIYLPECAEMPFGAASAICIACRPVFPHEMSSHYTALHATLCSWTILPFSLAFDICASLPGCNAVSPIHALFLSKLLLNRVQLFLNRADLNRLLSVLLPARFVFNCSLRALSAYGRGTAATLAHQPVPWSALECL